VAPADNLDREITGVFDQGVAWCHLRYNRVGLEDSRAFVHRQIIGLAWFAVHWLAPEKDVK
jgi:hypothetical protein